MDRLVINFFKIPCSLFGQPYDTEKHIDRHMIIFEDLIGFLMICDYGDFNPLQWLIQRQSLIHGIQARLQDSFPIETQNQEEQRHIDQFATLVTFQHQGIILYCISSIKYPGRCKKGPSKIPKSALKLPPTNSIE